MSITVFIKQHAEIILQFQSICILKFVSDCVNREQLLCKKLFTYHISFELKVILIQILIFVQIVLYNRMDSCCSSRLNNFIITVGDSESSTENQICVSDGGDVANTYKIINRCNPPLRGRYVHVMVKGIRSFALCEIQVYESIEGLYNFFSEKHIQKSGILFLPNKILRTQTPFV